VTLDAAIAARALALGLTTEAELRRWAEPDPFEAMTIEQRIAYAVEHAASGAWADCPPAVVTVNGRAVAVPPGYRPHRGPRGRSPRGRSTGPAADTDATAQPACAPVPGANERAAH